MSTDVDVAATAEREEKLVLGEYQFNSRLFVGTGKYADFAVLDAAPTAVPVEALKDVVKHIQ